ncbi:flagellar hook-associated protein FlgL [Methylibium sp.]|uniref:flagellar hook-associated protein FlgL n=1 Tax=Methylibium sp. TaxID=2067992 RepID=UPI003D0D7A28
MRMSTANTYDATIANLQRRAQELSQSQEQMSSLKRVNRASDDPTAAARAERALAVEARSAASQRGIDASMNAVSQTESTLGDALTLLQQARDTVVSAGNASYSDAERANLALTLRQMRAELLTVANSPDGAGSYLFAGQGASSPPFVDTPSGVQFRGVSGEAGAAATEPLPLTMDGQSTWLQARSGNGVFVTSATQQNGTAWIDSGRVTDPALVTGDAYSVSFAVSGATTTYTVLHNGNPTTLTNLPYKSGQAIEIDGLSVTVTGDPANADRFDITPSSASLSIFDALDRAATELETGGRNSGQLAQTVADSLRDIDASAAKLTAQRSVAGETLNRIDRATERLSGQKLAAQTDRSQAEDLDMVEAISTFQKQQTGYQAALQSYASVQKLSLFQYLNL